MGFEVAGVGNALMDALVVLDDGLVEELGLVRGTMHPVDHPRWQEVYERVRRHKVTFESGGSCANALATVGFLGAKAIFTGLVGDDQIGHMYAARMTEACGEHALQFTDERATGKCLSIISSRDAERTMLTDLGAATSLPHLGAFADVLRDTKVAHFEGYTLLGGPMKQTVLEALHIAHGAGAIVTLDASDPFVVREIRDTVWHILEEYVSVVFLNADEAMGLTGMAPDEAVYEIARRTDVRTVVVKLGARGSLVLEDGLLHRIGIQKVQAIDTTGAGDAYAAGFLYGLAKGWGPVERARLGAAVAGLAVAQIGAVVKDRAVLASTVAEIEIGRTPEVVARVGA